MFCISVHSLTAELEFICSQPSCIAGAAIVAAIQGLTHTTQTDMAPCIDRIASILGTSSTYILPLLCALESSAKRVASGSRNADNTTQQPGDSSSTSLDGNKQQYPPYSKLSSLIDEDEVMIDTDGKETPVDVLDVQF